MKFRTSTAAHTVLAVATLALRDLIGVFWVTLRVNERRRCEPAIPRKRQPRFGWPCALVIVFIISCVSTGEHGMN